MRVCLDLWSRNTKCHTLAEDLLWSLSLAHGDGEDVKDGEDDENLLQTELYGLRTAADCNVFFFLRQIGRTGLHRDVFQVLE